MSEHTPETAYEIWKRPESQKEMQLLFDTQCQILAEAYQCHLQIFEKARQEYNSTYNPRVLTKKQQRSPQYMKDWYAKIPAYEEPQILFAPLTDILWFKYNPEPKCIPCDEWLLDMQVPFTLTIDVSFQRRPNDSWNSPRPLERTEHLIGKMSAIIGHCAIPKLTTLVIRISDNRYNDNVTRLHEVFPEHPHLSKLVISGANAPTTTEWYESGKMTPMVEYISDNTYVDASCSNSCDQLTTLKAHGAKIPYEHICCIAAEYGHINILSWVDAERHKDVKDKQYPEDHLFNMPYADICHIAARHGKMAPIEWVDAQRQLIDGPSAALTDAVKNGHWLLFCTLAEWKPPHMQFKCDKNVFRAIVLTGNIEMLKWYVEGKHPTYKVNTDAVTNGNLRVLDWLHTHKCLSNRIINKALDCKKWDIAKWAIVNGYRVTHTKRYGYYGNDYDEETSEDETSRYRNRIKQYKHNPKITKLTCTLLAQYGQWDLLKFAHEELQCEMDAHTFKEIARKGNFTMMQWAHERNCLWDANTSAAIATQGDLALLQWARERGCPWNAKTCAEIATLGKLTMLQWARENGCPWNGQVCVNAAKKNNTELLYWAESNGCDTTAFYEQFGSCSGCGKGGYDDIPCRCEKPRNPYFDDDNWRQRAEYDSDEARRQD